MTSHDWTNMYLTADLNPAVRDQIFMQQVLDSGATLFMQSGAWLYRFRLPITLIFKVL